MRVAVVTWGSIGEYRPFLALAAGLARAGHDVRLGAPGAPGFAEAAAGQGIPFVPLGPKLEEERIRLAGARAWQVKNQLQFLRVALRELLIPDLEAMYHDCVSLAADVDLLVSNVYQFAGRMAAETVGCPFVSGALAAEMLRTGRQPPGGLPNLGNRSNRWLWWLVTRPIDAIWTDAVNPVRQRVGLPPLRDVVHDGFFSPALNLVAVSPYLQPEPPDWAPRHRMTGFWFLDDPTWTPPGAVAEWVGRDPPPVAIGFGSLVDPDSVGLTRMVIEAVERAGVRAVIDLGRSIRDEGTFPASILPVRDVPHVWLLPRVRALVHHGGAGTTAAVLRQGIPSVFVPYFGDQNVWGARAARLGVAPPPIPRLRLTAPRLASAIKRAVEDDELRARAMRLRTIIRQEDGIQSAVQLLERFVARAADRQQLDTA